MTHVWTNISLKSLVNMSEWLSRAQTWSPGSAATGFAVRHTACTLLQPTRISYRSSEYNRTFSEPFKSEHVPVLPMKSMANLSEVSTFGLSATKAGNAAYELTDI